MAAIIGPELSPIFTLGYDNATCRRLPQGAARQAAGNGVWTMKRIARALAAAMLAAVAAGPAMAQDIKLFLPDGNATELYKDKKSFALVIGIDDYRSIKPELKFAASDAGKVADALRRHNFEVKLYNGSNMTGKQLRETIEAFVQEHGFIEDSRILIWYAGHGATVDGEGYLLGVDAPVFDPAAPGLDGALRDFYSASMPLRSFGVHLRQMRARHVMLVLDSCFAGTIFQDTRATPNNQMTLEMAKPVRQIITAGLAGEEVADNGKFARMFVEALDGVEKPGGITVDSNGDRYLSGTELGNFLAQAGRGTGQRPQYGKLLRTEEPGAGGTKLLYKTDQFDLDKGEFFFVLPGFDKGNETQVASIGQTAPVTAAVEVTWSAVETGSSIANVGGDPVPVYRALPASDAQKLTDLGVRQQFPARGEAAIAFERATVGQENWLRFKRNGNFLYVREDAVVIVRPQ
jgi:hypothetical protein